VCWTEIEGALGDGINPTARRASTRKGKRVLSVCVKDSELKIAI
jgi:hypothetical protein